MADMTDMMWREHQRREQLSRWLRGSAVGGSGLAFADLPSYLTPQERFLMEYHRKNLLNGTYLDDEQGLTTVNIMGVRGPDGRIYNVPGYADGRRLDERGAVQLAERLGWDNFPAYYDDTTVPRSLHPANVGARALHGLIDADGNVFRRYLGQ
jgi:hypothetical protein